MSYRLPVILSIIGLCIVLLWNHEDSKIEPLFYFNPTPIVKQMHIMNMDSIQKQCDKIKKLNKVLDIRYHMALENKIAPSEVSFEDWAKQCSISVNDLDRIIQESEIAKRELLSSNRKIISRWLISLLPRAEIPVYDIIDFALHEIIIAADIYDPDSHANFEEYLTTWLDESYKLRYEQDVSRDDDDIQYSSTFTNVDTNIAFSIVKYLIQKEVFKFLENQQYNVTKRNKIIDERNDIIYFIESTFHPVESSILLMQLGFYEDRSMSIQEISEITELSEDTVVNILGRCITKMRKFIY